MRHRKKNQILYDTGRWTEVKVPIGGKTKFLSVATYYGIAGANSDNRKKALNEHIVSMAIEKAINAGDEPYILCGDFNIEPEDSPAIAAAIEEGLLVDIGHEWAPRVSNEDDDERRQKQPDPTYSSAEPEPGMQGQGTTRIDLMLANPSAAAAVIAHYSRWDLVQERHVPQEVILDMQTLDSDEIIQRTAGKVTFADSEESEEELSMEDAYNEARSRYKEEYERALVQRDVNKAHVIWNKVAEVAILAGKGEPVEQAIDKVERAPWRGAPLVFKQRQRTKLVDRCGHPTVHRQKEINNLRNKLSDIRARLRRWEERHLNTEKTGEGSLHAWRPLVVPPQRLSYRRKARRRCTKTATTLRYNSGSTQKSDSKLLSGPKLSKHGAPISKTADTPLPSTAPI